MLYSSWPLYWYSSLLIFVTKTQESEITVEIYHVSMYLESNLVQGPDVRGTHLDYQEVRISQNLAFLSLTFLDVHSSNSVHIEEPPPSYDDFAKYKTVQQHNLPPTYEEAISHTAVVTV